MSSGYQVIARKWRPQTFDDVVGQDHVVRTLRNAIARGRIAHAYLFVGPRGTGKTSTARIFAKALNCTDGPKADFDPADPAVRAIADGTSMDVIEIDGASNNSVDQIRDLRDDVRYAPAQGKYKIYIIDEVHMLSNQAFNALLKTLEEPPAHVKFVFATTDVQKVLPTILSRCQRFDLKPIPAPLIVERLRKIAADEKIQVTDGALACIARMADGGMRDAQSIFDQMISFCGQTIAEADVLDVYGLVSEETVASLAAALATGDHAALVRIVDECDASGRDLVRLLADLQGRVRTALLDAIAHGGKSLQLGGASLTTEQITRMLDALREGESSVRLGLAERINFEVTLLKAVEASRARAIDSLIREIAALAESTSGDADGAKKKSLTAVVELNQRLAEQFQSVIAASQASLAEARSQSASRPPLETAGPRRVYGASPASAASAENGRGSANPPPRGGDTVPADDGASPDEDGPPLEVIVGDESSEAPGVAARPAPTRQRDEDDAMPAPPLAELSGRVPPALQEAMEELFRARFVRVARVPVSTPKAES